MKIKLLTLIFLLLGFKASCLKPVKNYINHPDSLGLNYESLSIKSSENIVLNGWKLIPSTEKDLKSTIILAYGDGGNMSYWLDYAKEMVLSGHTMVLFDYRGFGESSAFEMNLNQLYYEEFTEDLEAVINWSKDKIENKTLSIWALSMGTISATYALQNTTIDFLIAEGFVYDPFEIKRKLYELKGKEIILPKCASDYNSFIHTIKCPILLFSGTLDQITTVEEVNKIKLLNDKNQLLTFEGNHLEGFQKLTENSLGDEYVKSITSFISE